MPASRARAQVTTRPSRNARYLSVTVTSRRQPGPARRQLQALSIERPGAVPPAGCTRCHELAPAPPPPPRGRAIPPGLGLRGQRRRRCATSPTRAARTRRTSSGCCSIPPCTPSGSTRQSARTCSRPATIPGGADRPGRPGDLPRAGPARGLPAAGPAPAGLGIRQVVSSASRRVIALLAATASGARPAGRARRLRRTGPRSPASACACAAAARTTGWR